MTRTPQEVFAHHGQAFGAGDLDEIVADFADDAVEWAADAAASRADDGVDTFVFRDGLIHAQTLHYTLQCKG